MSRRTTRSATRAQNIADTQDVDAAFLALSKPIQASIDDAFDSVVSGSRGPEKKRRRTASKSRSTTDIIQQGAGGFVVDPPVTGGFIIDDTAGGFIPPSDDDELSSVTSHNEDSMQEPPKAALLSLDDVPDALAALGLPADDDVLSVLRNAASGWNTGSAVGISRKDWRAVCAVLLESAEENEGEDDVPAPHRGSEDDEEEDEYMESDLSDNDAAAALEESEPDEYTDKPVRRTRTHKTPTAKGGYLSTDSEEHPPRVLTPREKRECLTAFSLFFEDVDEQDLKTRRLTVTEVTRIAKLLKEGLSKEDILEMVGMFSSAPDKSLSLADFEQMMVATGLV